MLSRAFLSAFIGASHVYDCLENDDDDSMSPVSQLAFMFETCYSMDRWQQIGYFGYKARLRRDINDDWYDIDKDIWVSTFFSFFISFKTTWTKKHVRKCFLFNERCVSFASSCPVHTRHNRK